ncbi:MAG TPA: zinc-dependent alcohol dehydrogenase family protein [Acidimicrobiales bacterium]|jgi:propanol-preferring alcohol dehydrogenase|nr:zinc-dependent alcohol dehydrogenase family protein [Acidimicrobiales bacterium]
MSDTGRTSSTARAAVLERPAPIDDEPLVISALPASRLAPTDVLIDVAACGVCRTDLQLCEGDLAARVLPVVPGHQIVGRVRAIGDEVQGLQLGDRVGVAWIAYSCGTCRFCESGRENLCESARFTGWDRNGGFAEQATADHRFVYHLPPGGDDDQLAPLLCGGVIGYRCLRVAGATAGQRLGLYGFGASATIVIQIARHLGCEIYVATRRAEEQARALRLGATWAGSYDERPPRALDAAITFAPAGDVVIAALAAVDRGGTVVINAIHLDRIPEFAYDLLWWERSLRSVANVTRDDVRALLELAPAVPIVTERVTYRLGDANRALRDLRDGHVAGAAVLRP